MDTLLASSLIGLVVGSGYLAVGAGLAQRTRALAPTFAAFWLGIGAYAVVEALWVLDRIVGRDGGSLSLALLVLQVKIVSIVAAFAGLVSYLVAIYTGSHRLSRATLLAYIAVLVIVEWVYAMRQPIGVRDGTWGLQLVYAVPNVEPWWTGMLAVLMLPPAIAALAFLSLARVADEPPVRRRILLIGASLLLFFVPTFLAWKTGNLPWWGLVEKLLGAATASTMLAAQLLARHEGAQLAAQRKAGARARRAQLSERARRLV